ncbi:hypothetical protein PR003_g15594 [Phytophthora rubi]|uniref:No apical meristem-associated C-terminal domain-containing protein n=1 Tax=Phytophthora rubi TaxID=129364 RepID=A0A6A3L2I9_9STRA|nr:hypothetical protein PR002_g15848 [Phytophthora rubi]KAE9013851.1 hypothetical protein PR001_g15286 [Phytophthora rubi]KAE9329250.1 hypothetical protein PR003_g15594 [Phytophthora rubi]
MAGKKRKTRGSTASLDTVPETSPENFTPEEQERLSRAWIRVIEESAGYEGVLLTRENVNDLNGDIGSSFWEWVRDEYTSTGPDERTRSIEELHSQWISILPSLVEFLTLFCNQWVGSGLSSQDAEASQEVAFSGGQDAFQDKHGYVFPHEITVRLLVHHAKWITLVKPLLMPEENLSEEVPAAKPRKPSGALRGGKRLKTEGGPANDPPVRRVGPRRSDTEAASTGRLDENAEKHKLKVMERQLELDIMTYNEEGLSAEAVEYLRLQRAQILRKIRLQAGQP